MPEENENMNEELSSSEIRKQERTAKNARNATNNAKAVRAAADIASQSGNPYAMAIGKGVQVADKISGGKASENLGKALNTMNKMSGIQGKMMQAALNKMGESGTSDRIASAVNMKNGNAPSAPSKPNDANSGKADKTTQTNITDKTDEQSGDSGSATFGGDFKIVKYGLVGLVVLFPVIFCCLFISSSQVFTNAIDLGTADSLSGEEVEDKINTKGTDGLEEEKSDEDVAYDVYISDDKSEKLKNSKLRKNIVQVANQKTYLKRKYNEASLDAIEDFYPAVNDLSKNYDENMVYDFFFKMYNLYTTYRDTYDVYLDLPLLMATLNLQSTDKNVIFVSNLSAEDRKKTARPMPIDELDYYYNWSSYKISRDNSEHDMEILAQHMISKQVKEKCIDASGKVLKENILKDNQIGTQVLTCTEGETYLTEDLGYVKDDVKYREFLKQFLEKKYYLTGEHTIEDDVLIKDETNQNEDKPINTPASGNFRSWTQCGQSWSSTIVPKSQKNMCKIGCLVTSVTIQIARSGTAITTDYIDPGIALKKYRFYSGGNFDWNSTTNIAPNFKYYTRIITTGISKKAVAEKIASYDPKKYYGILLVSEKHENAGDHFVALDYVDTSTGEIYIMDPLSTKTTNLYSKYKIYKAYFYVKKD